MSTMISSPEWRTSSDLNQLRFYFNPLVFWNITHTELTLAIAPRPVGDICKNLHDIVVKGPSLSLSSPPPFPLLILWLCPSLVCPFFHPAASISPSLIAAMLGLFLPLLCSFHSQFVCFCVVLQGCCGCALLPSACTSFYWPLGAS